MPTGSAAATATTRSAVSSAASVAALRRGSVEVAHDLLVALERRRDVDDGVVRPLAARGERGRDARGAELGPARRTVEAGEDVHAGTTERRRDPGELAGVEAAELGLRQAAANPGPSSARPSCRAIDGACVSASTSAACRPPRASSTASSIATVVRPGAPAGPQTAMTRGWRGADGLRPPSGCGDAASASARRQGSMSSGHGPVSPKAATQAALGVARHERDDPHARTVAHADGGGGQGRRGRPAARPSRRRRARAGCARPRVRAPRPRRRPRERMPGSSSTTAIPSRSSPSASALPCGSSTATRIVIAPAPAVGTTESADSSAMAPSTAATSARGMTTSRDAAPPPIIESSRVTETTVASATRMLRRVVAAALDERRLPHLDDGARAHRRRHFDRAVQHDGRGGAPPRPRRRRSAGTSSPSVDRARRDEPCLERVGRQVRAFRAGRATTSTRRRSSPATASPGTIVRVAANTGTVCRDGGHDEPDADDGCRDQQDAEEEACVAPEGAGTRACGLDCRHATIVAQPPEIGPPDYPQAASCPAPAPCAAG